MGLILINACYINVITDIGNIFLLFFFRWLNERCQTRSCAGIRYGTFARVFVKGTNVDLIESLRQTFFAQTIAVSYMAFRVVMSPGAIL